VAWVVAQVVQADAGKAGRGDRSCERLGDQIRMQEASARVGEYEPVSCSVGMAPENLYRGSIERDDPSSAHRLGQGHVYLVAHRNETLPHRKPALV
jgi:hypothetical protein